MAQTKMTNGEITTKISRLPARETANAFIEILEAKAVKVFAVIDQAAEAGEVGLQLRDTILIIFGNPAAGTPVMQQIPLSALDLPLKVLVWDDGGETKVSYYSPSAIAQRYGLTQDLTANLRAIDALTDALVSR